MHLVNHDLLTVLVDHLPKTKKECKNLRKQYVYQNKIASYKVLCNKAFNIAQFPKYDWYERGLA